MWMLLALAATPDVHATTEAGAPTVTMRQRRGGHQVRVAAPAGAKLDEASPVELTLLVRGREVEAALPADVFGAGLPVGPLGEVEIEGTIRVVLCDPQTNVCTRSRWGLTGAPPRRGSAEFQVAPVEEKAPFGPTSGLEGLDAAFAASAKDGKPVLIDFSAVWCPPCRQLEAEVFHETPVALDAVHVAVVDADHPSSFSVKDRYDVGAYPTSVVVTADGTELTRMVGYPGEDAYLDWIAGSAEATDGVDRTRDPAELTGERAAAVAWAYASDRKTKKAEPFLARAEAQGATSTEVYLARAWVRPNADDIVWVRDHAPERLGDVLFPLMQLESSPKLVDEIVDQLVAENEGLDLVVALSYRADVAEKRGDEGSAQRDAWMAANLLEAIVAQNTRRARPHLTWLAALWDQAGQPDRGVALLEEAAARYVNDPTFHLSLAYHYDSLEEWPEALAAAEQAAVRAWGDITLRVAKLQAKALVSLGRAEEAAEVVEAALTTTELDKTTDVRTHAYRDGLSSWWSEARKTP